MKLWMPNDSHSFLACLGYLAGFQHISDYIQDSAFREAAYRLMPNEQASTLQITNVDSDRYVLSLLECFANPALKHKTWQITMDGSQKLLQRMLEGIRVHLARQGEWPLLALGVAGQMRYVSDVDDSGTAIDVRDPLSEKIAVPVRQSTESEHVNALLSLREVFATDLVQNPQFVAAIQQAWQHIAQYGVHQAVIETLKS